MILLAAQIALMMFDALAFLIAALVTPKSGSLALLPYLIGFNAFNGLVMRTVRLAAYLQEWLFDASSKDPYVPGKVHLMRKW